MKNYSFSIDRSKIIYLVILSAIIAIASLYNDLWMIFAIAKPLTTILVMCLPLLFTRGLESALAKYRWLVVVALTACLCGDTLLLNDDYFAYGLGAFLVAQLIFAFVFLRLCGEKIYLWVFIGLLMFSGFWFNLLAPNLGALTIPVATYMVCINLMCWQGIRLWLSSDRSVGKPLAIAAGLFLFSDFVIAINKFLAPFELADLAILTTYWASITLIAYSFSSNQKLE